MKRIVCLFAVLTFAAIAPSYGQGGAETSDSVQIGSLHRPTPKPGANPNTNAAKASTGPMEATLSKDAKGQSAATTFAPTDTIYVVGKNISAKKGDKLGVSWYGGKPEKKLTSQDITVPDEGVYGPSFHLSPPPKGTSAGSYRADLTQNGKVLKRLPFSVK